MGKPRQIVRLKVVAHGGRAALGRLFAPFAAFFETAGAPLSLLESSRAGDQAVARRFAAALHDPRAPQPLVALAEALDALAHDNVAAMLLKGDVGQQLPRGTLGTVDLALAALLDAPDLARKVLVAARVLRVLQDARRAYTDCVPADERPIAYAPGQHEALVRAHAARFVAKDASAYCDVYVTETEEVWMFEVTHGDRPRTREVIDTAQLALALVTDVAAHRAYAVLDKRTRWLSVAAHAPSVKDLVRAAFGEALAGDHHFFLMGEVYDLSPLASPETALATRGVPGLEGVELVGITVWTPPGRIWTVDLGKDHYLSVDPRERAQFSDLLAMGKLTTVKLRMKLEGRAQAATVLLTARGGRNVLEIDREDTELAAIAIAWFRACGVLPRAAAVHAPSRAEA